MGTAARSTHEPGSVAVVNTQQRVVAIRERADRVQLRDRAVHGEDAVGEDQDVAGALRAGLAQLALEVVQIVVGVAVRLALHNRIPSMTDA